MVEEEGGRGEREKEGGGARRRGKGEKEGEKVVILCGRCVRVCRKSIETY